MRLTMLALALPIVVSGRPARADDAEASRKADALFNEGKALLETDLNKACQKFEQSLTYNSQALGTLLNVALCDEKRGRVASAVARFKDAKARAREGGMVEHQQAAERHIAALTPKIPHVTIKFAEEPSAATTLVVGDKVVPLSARDDLAIDPGTHAVKVSAPGRLAYHTTFAVAEAERVEISIPVLESSVTVTSSRRTIGKITSIAGVAAIGTGVILGVIANAMYDRQFTTRPAPTAEQMALGITPGTYCTKLPNKAAACNSDGLAATNNALTIGNFGTVIGIVGIAAAGVGVYLWIRSPSETTERRITLVPQAGPDGAGIVAVGHF